MNPAATITTSSINELSVAGCQPPTPLKEDFSVTWETSTIAIISVQQESDTASVMIVLQGQGRLEVVSMTHRSRLESPIEVHGYPIVARSSPLDFHAPSWANMWITVSNCQMGDVLRVLSTNDAVQPTFSIYHPLHDEEACATVYPISWRKSVADIVKDVSERMSSNNNDDDDDDDDAGQKYAHSAFFNDEDDSSIEKEEQSDGKVVIAFCGAKNVGKSTCLQYCWNQLLASGAIGNQPLAILDADPGQPLCSMIGQLQVSLVQSPSGVSWTPSLTEVLKSHYFGSVTSETDPTTYLQCVQSLMEAFRNESSAHVLLVNLDGWVKGLGLQILTTLLQSVIRPDHVVGLTGTTPSKSVDFSMVITKESQQLHLCTGFGVDDFQNLQGARRSPLPSAVLRSIRLVSYFLDDTAVVDQLLCSVGVTSSGLVDPDCEIAEHFASLVPYMVPIDEIAIEFCDTNISLSEDAKLMALNGSVVGLCRRKEHDGSSGASLLSCVGLGIVRAVDKEQRILFILTPRTTQLDDTVNVLTIGSTVQLPFECYFRGVHSTGFPFLALEDHTGLNLIGAEFMKSRNGIGRRGLGLGPPQQQSRPGN